MRTIIALFVICVLLASLTGCGSSKKTEEPKAMDTTKAENQELRKKLNEAKDKLAEAQKAKETAAQKVIVDDLKRQLDEAKKELRPSEEFQAIYKALDSKTGESSLGLKKDKVSLEIRTGPAASAYETAQGQTELTKVRCDLVEKLELNKDKSELTNLQRQEAEWKRQNFKQEAEIADLKTKIEESNKALTDLQDQIRIAIQVKANEVKTQLLKEKRLLEASVRAQGLQLQKLEKENQVLKEEKKAPEMKPEIHPSTTVQSPRRCW